MICNKNNFMKRLNKKKLGLKLVFFGAKFVWIRKGQHLKTLIKLKNKKIKKNKIKRPKNLALLA